MTSLNEIYTSIINLQLENDYRMKDWLQPPASPEDIKACELALGFSMNDELKELYSHSNGVILNENSCDEYLLPFERVLCLEEIPSYRVDTSAFPQFYTNSSNNFTPGNKLFAFISDDAGNRYWVDLNDDVPENYGKIYWTNSWGEEPDYKFSSLTAMFTVILAAYKKSIITVGKDGYLDCDLKKLHALAKEMEPEISYWSKQQ